MKKFKVIHQIQVKFIIRIVQDTTLFNMAMLKDIVFDRHVLFCVLFEKFRLRPQ